MYKLVKLKILCAPMKAIGLQYSSTLSFWKQGFHSMPTIGHVYFHSLQWYQICYLWWFLFSISML